MTNKCKGKYRGLSTAAAKCAAFGRDDVIFGVGRAEKRQPQIPPLRCGMTNKGTGNNNSKGKIQGSLRYGGKCAAFGRDDVILEWVRRAEKTTADPCGMTNKGQATTTAKAKYRGLSATAAKCAAFGRDDVIFGLVGKNRQRQQR
jgi:hypothetical protein